MERRRRGTLRLFSELANGREAQEIAEKLLQKSFRMPRKDYELPNAMVGFQPGGGEVADYWLQGAARRADQLRVIIVVAVKNDGVGGSGWWGPESSVRRGFRTRSAVRGGRSAGDGYAGSTSTASAGAGILLDSPDGADQSR